MSRTPLTCRSVQRVRIAECCIRCGLQSYSSRPRPLFTGDLGKGESCASHLQGGAAGEDCRIETRQCLPPNTQARSS